MTKRRFTIFLLASFFSIGVMVHGVYAALPPPVLSWTTPGNDNTPTFTWQPVSGAASYQFSLDNSGFSNLGNVTAHTINAPLADGKHSFAVKAIDSSGVDGATNSYSYFVIDTSAPVVSAVTPTTATAGVSQTFAVTYSDVPSVVDCQASGTCNAIGVKSCDFYANNVNMGSMTLVGTSSGTASFSTTLNATSTVQARCYDPATNVGTGTLTTIMIAAIPDTTPPTAPGNLTRIGAFTNAAPSFSWSAASDNAAVSGYEISLDGAAYTSVGNVLVYTHGILPVGSHVINVRAKDVAGNVSGVVSLTFTITAIPSPILPAPPTSPFTIDQMNADARLTATGVYADLQSALGSRGCELTQDQGKAKTAAVFGYINGANMYFQVVAFTACGTISSRQLGSGERAGIIASYQTAFGHIPSTASEWSDVIKIGNGRFPAELSTSAEASAKAHFRQIYLRDPNMNQQYDKAAVAIMAYGLRPLPRNVNSEAAAIVTFGSVFKTAPTTATQWNEVRAIAYSGARR